MAGQLPSLLRSEAREGIDPSSVVHSPATGNRPPVTVHRSPASASSASPRAALRPSAPIRPHAEPRSTRSAAIRLVHTFWLRSRSERRAVAREWIDGSEILPPVLLPPQAAGEGLTAPRSPRSIPGLCQAGSPPVAPLRRGARTPARSGPEALATDAHRSAPMTRQMRSDPTEANEGNEAADGLNHGNHRIHGSVTAGQLPSLRRSDARERIDPASRGAQIVRLPVSVLWRPSSGPRPSAHHLPVTGNRLLATGHRPPAPAASTNQRNASLAPLRSCSGSPARYALIRMIEAGAWLRLQYPKNAMIARVWAVFSAWASGTAASDSFHRGNDKGRRSRSAFSPIRAMSARVGLSPERFQPAKDLPAPPARPTTPGALFSVSGLRASIPISNLLPAAPAPSGKRPTQCW